MAAALKPDPKRLIFVGFLVAMLFAVMLVKLVHLHATQGDFLRAQGDARTLRIEELPAQRGMVYDRRGQPLAISTPMTSLWLDPRLWNLQPDEQGQTPHVQRLQELAADLNQDFGRLKARVEANQGRGFMYLQRQMIPEQAAEILAKRYPGVGSQTEYQRFYPAGEVTAHVVGFTDTDGNGLEGLERTYQAALLARPGRQRVLRDVRGQVVRDLEELQAPRNGQDLHLTLDMRLQYLAHRELKQAMLATEAKAGTLVVMDPRTGEILAMVNQPSFNPNNRAHLEPEAVRNRAVIDTFEPGSVLKTFTIASAVEQGLYRPDQAINTSPGFLRLGSQTVRDFRDYGTLDLTGIMAKSSNVGTSKIAIDMGPELLWDSLWQVGFGQPVGVGIPGELSGSLPNHNHWNDIRLATLSYGYGLQVSAVQLARAYSAIANDGVLPPVRLVQGQAAEPDRRVYSPETARAVRGMLAEAIGPNGTARRADLALYSAGGKTGTVHKVGQGGYLDDSYRSLFVGMAPIDQPELVVVVMIDEPQGNQYYGGEVAAPIFADFMNRALPAAGVGPDRGNNRVAGVGGGAL